MSVNICKMEYVLKCQPSNVQTFFLLADTDGKPAEMISKNQQTQLKKKYRVLHETLGEQAESLTSRFSGEAEFEETVC